MKISIYELLGMIKDGKAPKRIVFKNNCYQWFNDEGDYITETHWLFDEYVITDILNDELEILETTITIKDDKFTGWEAETKCDDEKNLLVSNKIEKLKEEHYSASYEIISKINEIIDRINNE